MSELYNISSSPHIRAKDTSAKIMLYVIIALLPASIFGVYNFGLRALLLQSVSQPVWHQNGFLKRLYIKRVR